MQQRSAWAAAVAGSEGRPLLRTEALWIELGEHIREGKWVPGKSRSPDQATAVQRDRLVDGLSRVDREGRCAARDQGEPPRYHCHLGCILLEMAAISDADRR